MKITKTASGKTKIVLTKSEWKSIGKKAGWVIEADIREHSYYPSYIKQDFNTMQLIVDDPDISDDIIECPAKYGVCPTCQGRGSYVNPSIDSHGIGSEEFNEDPGFQEDYYNGAYDMQCSSCRGKRVILEPVDPNSECAKKIQDILQEESNYRAEVAAEQRYMGQY